MPEMPVNRKEPLFKNRALAIKKGFFNETNSAKAYFQCIKQLHQQGSAAVSNSDNLIYRRIIESIREKYVHAGMAFKNIPPEGVMTRFYFDAQNMCEHNMMLFENSIALNVIKQDENKAYYITIFDLSSLESKKCVEEYIEKLILACANELYLSKQEEKVVSTVGAFLGSLFPPVITGECKKEVENNDTTTLRKQ